MSDRRRLMLVVGLYLLSLVLPAFSDVRRDGSFHSPAFGWMCVIFVPVVCILPAWWANICLLVGCTCLAHQAHFAARLWGILAVALAASFPIQWPFFNSGKTASLGIAFYLWIASMVVLVFVKVQTSPVSEKPENLTAIDEV